MRAIMLTICMAILACNIAVAKPPGDKFRWNFDLGPNVSPQINDITDGHIGIRFYRDDVRVEIVQSTFNTTDRNIARLVGDVDGEPLQAIDPCVVGHLQLPNFDFRGDQDLISIDCALENGGTLTVEIRGIENVSGLLFPYLPFTGVANPIGLVPPGMDSNVFVSFPDGRVRNGIVESWTGTKSND